MESNTVQKESWGSAFGFIMSSIGYAVGVGAIWKFPYMIGMNGGGTFLILCIFVGIVVCIPLLWGELTLGRTTQKTAIAGMRELEGKKGSPWTSLAYLGCAAGFIMVAYYATIVGDIFAYIFKFASGALEGLSAAEISTAYDTMQASAGEKFLWSFLVFALCGIILGRGIQKGLEAVSKVLIPLLFLFLIILAIRGMILPGGMEGVKWFFTPDLSKISIGIMPAVINQCFFLAGVGLASAFAFGSYLDQKESDIPFNGAVIILSNFVVAILAGVAIFPALFAYGLDVQSGSGLVFKTLPFVFNEMAGGRIWGTMFFLLVFIAGFSSCLGLMEGTIATISEAFGFSRFKTTIGTVIAAFICSAPAILAYTTFKDIQPLGMDLFTFMDWLAVGLLCPLSAVLIGLYVVTKFKNERFIAEVNVGAKYFKVAAWMKPWYVIAIPILTIVVIIYYFMACTGML